MYKIYLSFPIQNGNYTAMTNLNTVSKSRQILKKTVNKPDVKLVLSDFKYNTTDTNLITVSQNMDNF